MCNELEIMPLSAEPIIPPKFKREPLGINVSLEDIVKKAKMLYVVSSNYEPDIRIHNDKEDFKVQKLMHIVYCLSEHNLPKDEYLRSREILRRLAYSFHLWEAWEIVGRYHRDLKRNLDNNFKI